jgi:hypothetical protein
VTFGLSTEKQPKILYQENKMVSRNAYNERPVNMVPGNIYGYKIIAVIYSGGFWCAYRGLTAWSDEQVASEGDKIEEEAARSLFPTIANSFIWND